MKGATGQRAYAERHTKAGLGLMRGGRVAEAIEEFRLAVKVAPREGAHHLNLGFALMQAGQATEAVKCLERCLKLSPASAEARLYLGGALRALGKDAQAERALRAAVELAPKNEAIRLELSRLLYDLGRVDEAHAVLGESPLPPSPGRRLRLALTRITPIPRSSAHIEEMRAEYEAQLDALTAEGTTIQHPEREVDVTPFFLSYHGLPNRALQEKLARLHLAAQPGLAWTAPHCASRRKPGKLRIGIISRFLYWHSVGRTTRGLVAMLDREKFELSVIFIPPFVRDSCSQGMAADAARSLVLPNGLQAARAAIAELELDVLFYQDIGMDPFTYFLAFARLAPIQCVSFGHPDTSGIPNIDWYISLERFERQGADADYSERLWRIPEVGNLSYYYHPAREFQPKTRAQLGLPEGARLYTCAQALFKLHPDFDSLVARILRMDGDGRLVLAGRPPFRDRLMERLRRAMPDVLDRVMVLPIMDYASYLGLLAASDVILDTPHFNGYNTSLEAFAVGSPVVTRPGPLQRMRHTAGMYGAMGIDGLCASTDEQYVQLALDIANNADQRRAYSRLILERQTAVYEDLRVIRGFEAFFEHVARQQ